MSTYNAFYIRKQASDEVTRAAILKLYPKARIEASACFVGAVLAHDEFEPRERHLLELSGTLATDVIWVAYQSTVGAFIFHHWQSGLLVRALWFGCRNEGTWDRVAGSAEPWEHEALWNDEALEDLLQFAESDAEQEKLKALWKDGLLKEGESEPLAASVEVVHAVMEHYGLYAEGDPKGGCRTYLSRGVPKKQVEAFGLNCLGDRHEKWIKIRSGLGAERVAMLPGDRIESCWRRPPINFGRTCPSRSKSGSPRSIR